MKDVLLANAELIPYLIAWVVVSLVNGVLPLKFRSSVVQALTIILDRISYTPRKDAAGSVKIPLAASRPLVVPKPPSPPNHAKLEGNTP